MKRIALMLLAVAALLLPGIVAAPAASATGVISNGLAITTHQFPTINPFDTEFCTLGAVGTDSSGNKIGITAAHCAEGPYAAVDGAPFYRMAPGGPREHIGTIAYRSPGGTYGEDWLVIKLNSDAVLTSNGPGARIDGIGAANPTGIHCKDGAGTGVRCGTITTSTATRFYSTALIGGGDSGGPAFQDNTKIVGLNRGTGDGGFEFIKFSTVLAGIAAQSNPVGQGFVITNN